MSDWYQAVAVCDVQPDESKDLADAVIARFVSDGIVQPIIDRESVLGGDGGYRPGPRISSLYKLLENEGAFWTCRTNGVEVCVNRWVNQLGFTCIDGFTCPACLTHFKLHDDAVADPFAKAIGSFLDGGNNLDVECPTCAATNAVPKWTTEPHLGFTNLAFQFWNWPPLNYNSWRVDLPAVIEFETNRKVIVTYGRL
jgi:hypothetical protein